MSEIKSYPITLDLFDREPLFFEWSQLQALVKEHPYVNLDWQEYGSVRHKNTLYPLISFSFGSQNPEAPVLVLTSGVHGLERIGVQTLLSLLRMLFSRFNWDRETQFALSKIRFCVFPFVNPVGLALGSRSNKNGVDLMRNSPIDDKRRISPIYGGHQISALLPWYQGNPEQPELETKSVYQFFQRGIKKASRVISIDFHSGFGMKDRIWFPYAYKKEPFEDFSYVTKIFNIFENSYPHHFYKIEPTSLQYQISGDIWDKIYQDYKKANPKGVYLPLTLEMGSWLWVKKNPSQLFSKWGLFHPLKTHREKRVLRRHITFFDFIIRALLNSDVWATLDKQQKDQLWDQGLKRWYA